MGMYVSQALYLDLNLCLIRVHHSDGMIDFREFATGVSVCFPGSPEDKVHCTSCICITILFTLLLLNLTCGMYVLMLSC
jgi:hypothetical protein